MNINAVNLGEIPQRPSPYGPVQIGGLGVDFGGQSAPAPGWGDPEYLKQFIQATSSASWLARMPEIIAKNAQKGTISPDAMYRLAEHFGALRQPTDKKPAPTPSLPSPSAPSGPPAPTDPIGRAVHWGKQLDRRWENEDWTTQTLGAIRDFFGMGQPPTWRPEAWNYSRWPEKK